MPAAVYDTLIASVRAAQPLFARYLELRRQILGLDKLAPYDLVVPLSPEPEPQHAYREGVDLVLGGLDLLGEEYVDDLRSGFEGRWVDVHETKGKRSGAYSWGAYAAPPVILMNWNGTMNDVFTLAHEAGHAMHSFYADANLPFHEAGYPSSSPRSPRPSTRCSSPGVCWTRPLRTMHWDGSRFSTASPRPTSAPSCAKRCSRSTSNAFTRWPKPASRSRSTS